MEEADPESEEGEVMEGEEMELADVVITGDTVADRLSSYLEEYTAEVLFPPLDGTSFYKNICKINHSCEPNVRVKYSSTVEHGLVANVVALRDIQPNEELLQSYIDENRSMILIYSLYI